jgi:single-strand DNA-binding protein
MSGSMNLVILIGNCGADPEIRRTQDGRPIATLRLATSETWRDKTTGERREKTEWHQVVIFTEGLCKIVEQYVRKGSKVAVQGQLQTRKWQDAQGQDRYTTEVVIQGFNASLTLLGDSRSSGYRPGGNGAEDYGLDRDRAGRTTGGGGGAPAGSFSRDLDDDIPFAPEWRG